MEEYFIHYFFLMARTFGAFKVFLKKKTERKVKEYLILHYCLK
jgi:hypothetical protein